MKLQGVIIGIIIIAVALCFMNKAKKDAQKTTSASGSSQFDGDDDEFRGKKGKRLEKRKAKCAKLLGVELPKKDSFDGLY
jgi:hypothetical protein